MSDEEQTIRRAQAGDHRAYGELVARYQQVAFRVAFLITGSSHDAEEAAQEAFVKGYQALPRFRPKEPFRPWIVRIASNEAYSLVRSRSRHRTLGERAQAAATDQAHTPAGTDDVVLAGQERRAIARALSTLTDRDRAVITCRYVLDLSEAETAAVLGCRPGTVKSRLSRALDRLRACEETRDLEATR